MNLERKDLDYLEMVLARAWDLEESEREQYLDSCLGKEGRLRRQAAALVSAGGDGPGSWEGPLGLIPPVPEDPPSETAAWEPEAMPRFIGVYRLGELLGEGGMGSVFRAVRSDDEYRKEVAVKVLRRENVTADLVQRFRRERQILAALSHPNIARLLDGGTSEDGLPYLVMEMVRGEPIDLYCERHLLSFSARLDLIRTVCQAVQSAHQNLIVHRDLKPSNILVTDGGEPVLLDFGIAKILNPSFSLGGSSTTRQWNRILTPDYASPEQIRAGVIGITSDVYSIGVILYQLLTGGLPQRASHSVSETDLNLADHHIVLPSEAFRKLLKEEPDKARELAAHRGLKADAVCRYLAGDLDRIVAKALHPVQKLRYSSTDRLAEDLQWFEEGLPISAHEPAWTYKTGKFLRRNRKMVLLACLICLSLGFLVTGLVVQKKELAVERDLARLERDKARGIAHFLESLFAATDPFGVASFPGETVSREVAEEFLEVGALRVQRDLADRPALRATILNRIGQILGTLGYGERAEELLRKALETRQTLLGFDHPDTAESLRDLGGVVMYNDSPEKAEPLVRRAVEIQRREIGPGTELAASLRGLASIMSDLGRNEEAKELARESWEMVDRETDPTNLETLDTRVVYASMLLSGDEQEKAEELLRGGLEVIEGLEGPAKAYGAFFTHQLASVLLLQGELAEAESYFRMAIEHLEQLFPPENGVLATAVGNLGLTVRDQGRFVEAEELLKLALDKSRANYGARHPAVVTRLNNLAGLALLQREPGKAEILYQEALEIAEEVVPKQHRRWINILAGSGFAKAQLGKGREAEESLRRAVALARERYGETGWATFYYRLTLGYSLLKQGRIEEAEPLIVEAREPIFAVRPRGGVERRRVLQVLIEFYQITGDADLARQYQVELEAEEFFVLQGGLS